MMLIKRLSLLLVVAATASSAYANTTDPFMKTWLYNNGINTYKLVISKSNAPRQTYSVKMEAPGERFGSDMCNATSDISIQCIGGVTLIRDDVKHLVTVNSLNYYDPDYLPVTPAIFGTWKSKNMMGDTVTQYMVIRASSNSNEIIVDSSAQENNVNYCVDQTQITLKKTTNEDGTESYSRRVFSDVIGFTHDPVKKQIIPLPKSLNRDGGIHVGCAQASDNTVFIKD